MLTEAIRAYLASLGMTEVATWTHGQIMEHVDEVFQMTLERDDLSVESVLDDFFIRVRANMITINETLKQDPA